MPTFDNADIVVKDDCHVVYRRGAVLGLCISGVIDDERSDRWRQSLEAEVLRAGFPDYYAIDGTAMRAKNSPGSRLRTALFVRGLMRQARHAVILSSAQTGSTIVMRTLLRLAGVSNIRMVTTVEDFAATLQEMHAGKV
jgi:hypothetical protein